MKKALSFLLAAVVAVSAGALPVPSGAGFASITAEAADAAKCGDFYYTLDAEGCAAVTRCDQWRGELVIPAELDGHKVTAIADRAFESSCFTKVTFPDTLETIGAYAFFGCGDLTAVTMPDGVRKIGAYSLGYSAEECEGTSEKIEGFTIVCMDGSAASEYAEKNGFRTKPKYDLLSALVSIPYSSYTYRGRAVKPAVTVRDAYGTLSAGEDYTFTISDNTAAGRARITVTGCGRYEGASLTKYFTVKPLDLGTHYAAVSVPYASYTYTGKAIKPKVTVRFKDGSLIPESEYTVKYSNNTAVGVATATVTGKGGSVKGTYKKTFVIKPEKNSISSLTAGNGCFRLKWKKATAGAVGYQVLYCRDKAALNAAAGECKSSDPVKYVHSYTSLDKADLSECFSRVPRSGEVWYVKVRSFVTKDGTASAVRYGNYSAVKSVTVK